jgi:hypothetical protein
MKFRKKPVVIDQAVEMIDTIRGRSQVHEAVSDE